MHRHLPQCTGRRIVAEYGKSNLPDGVKPVISTGESAVCIKCGALLIVHDQRLGFAKKFTEIAA